MVSLTFPDLGDGRLTLLKAVSRMRPRCMSPGRHPWPYAALLGCPGLVWLPHLWGCSCLGNIINFNRRSHNRQSCTVPSTFYFLRSPGRGGHTRGVVSRYTSQRPHALRGWSRRRNVNWEDLDFWLAFVLGLLGPGEPAPRQLESIGHDCSLDSDSEERLDPEPGLAVVIYLVDQLQPKQGGR